MSKLISRALWIFPAALIALTACPEPPASAPTQGGAPGQGAPGAPGAPGVGGPVAGGAPPASVKPEFTQEQLATAADTITFAGKIICEANPGPFVVHIFPPPPADGGGAAPSDSPPQLITEHKVEKVGEFTLKVPKGDDVVVLAFPDNDGDGAPGPEEAIFFHNDTKAVKRVADLAGVELDCSKVVTPPAPADAVNPPTGTNPGPGGTPIEPGVAGVPAEGAAAVPAAAAPAAAPPAAPAAQ